MKPYRLLLKRRLSKKHKEELDGMLSIQAREEAEGEAGGGPEGPPPPTREELVAARKARLEELFVLLLTEYSAVIGKTAPRAS